MGRPKGSKNKPKQITVDEFTTEEVKVETKRSKGNGVDVWYIYEIPHRGKRQLVTYTEYGEKAAKQFIKRAESERPRSKFDIVHDTGFMRLRIDPSKEY